MAALVQSLIPGSGHFMGPTRSMTVFAVGVAAVVMDGIRLNQLSGDKDFSKPYKNLNIVTLALHVSLCVVMTSRWFVDMQDFLSGFYGEFIVYAHVLFTTLIPTGFMTGYAMMAMDNANSSKEKVLCAQFALSLLYGALVSVALFGGHRARRMADIRNE